MTSVGIKLLNQKSAIALLTLNGWSQSTGGKHSVKMVKPGERPITLPRHNGNTYGKGLTAAIMRQARIDRGSL